MIGLRKTVLLLVLLSSAGCSPYRITDSAAAPGILEAPRKVLFITRFTRNLGPPKIEPGVTSGVTEALAACGIQAAAFAQNPMALDDDKKLAALRANLDPDAILLLRQSMTVVAGIASGGAEYEIRFFMPATGRVLWTASARTSAAWDTKAGNEQGRAFGAAIVAAMATDGALRTCTNLPPPAR